MKEALKKLVLDHNNDWDVHLFAYRIIVQAATARIPFFLVYRREARHPFGHDVLLDAVDDEAMLDAIAKGVQKVSPLDRKAGMTPNVLSVFCHRCRLDSG